MGVIAYQNKDIASKLTTELLVGNHLGPFGLPEKKVVGLLPTNLPAVESNELRLDNLFEMEDGAVAILDYESEFSRENFVKYLNYVARSKQRIFNWQSKKCPFHQLNAHILKQMVSVFYHRKIAVGF